MNTPVAEQKKPIGPAVPLTSIPPDLVSVQDYERYARAHIDPAVFEYIYGGGADEISLCRNRSAFDELMIYPRVLRDLTQGSTHLRLLQEDFRHPILLAPVAFQKMVHPGGESAVAQAASLLEAGMIVSTLASEPLEDIARQTQSPRWFQLYFQQSRDFTMQLVRRAKLAGYSKLVVTVDAPLHGIRNRAQRAGFVLPEDVTAINLNDRPELPRRVLNPSQSIVFQGMMSEAPTWEDIRWLVEKSEMPVILKGILHPQDAVAAKAIGVAGVIVSNHGGRTLDTVPSAMDVIRTVRATVGPGYPVLLDGGVQRGTDVFKAIAMGADAVLIGRPQVYALAVAGALGVAHMLRVLREELEVAMSLAGTATLADITPDMLFRGVN